MTQPARFPLPDDVAASVPTGRRRRWDQNLVHLVESKPIAPEIPVIMAKPVLPANVLAIEQARARVTWAATTAEHEEAQGKLDALLQGRVAAEPVPAPAPVPPVSPAGWDVRKVVERDPQGLITGIAETWRATAEPA